MNLLIYFLCLTVTPPAAADDAVEIFKGSSSGPPPNLLFTSDDGSALLGRSINPLHAIAAGLSPRQGRCPYPVPCSATTCCPASTKCCGTGIKCCPTDSHCVSTSIEGCCPYSAQTCGGKFCAEPGATCCGNSICRPGYVCNTNGGTSCCRPDEVKCLGTCCPVGSQCSTQTGYCVRSRMTSLQRTATSLLASTAVSSILATKSPDSCVVGVTKRGRDYSAELQKRQNLQPNCEYDCHNGKRIPVLEIPNIAGQTDQLFISMCSGIMSTGGKRGGDGSNFDILKYAGDGKRAKRIRRRKAKCSGYCAEQKRTFNDPAKLECDEYPPDGVVNGVAAVHRLCIPAAQNSGEQGKRFGDFVNKCKPPPGSNFMVRMKGGCNLRKRDSLDTAAWRKRQAQPASTFEAAGSALRDLGNSSFIYIPFEDLQNGHYHVDTQFQGDILSISVIDSDGDTYFTSEGVSDGRSIDFDVSEVDDDDPMPAALIIDTTRQVNVSYRATVTPSNATSKSEADSVIQGSHIWFLTSFILPALLAWAT
ncbi:uncharacterized protein K441DRAFT_542647 [Cenococcum geophilum 1.58]|uniref:uncharacterized protein n=1 Tax=Cenococcum geophilum 1.58 TaxID=794803 RepID=UPI00358F9340|nr:hypothetical protein K441DRAFT_542647 [Cenococcum geophilum 1.58]